MDVTKMGENLGHCVARRNRRSLDPIYNLVEKLAFELFNEFSEGLPGFLFPTPSSAWLFSCVHPLLGGCLVSGRVRGRDGHQCVCLCLSFLGCQKQDSDP